MADPALYPPDGPLILQQGRTFRRRMRLSVEGEPVVLTGATVRMQVRRTRNSANAIIALESGAAPNTTGIQITDDGSAMDAEYSEFIVYISDEDAEGFTFSSAVMQLEVEFSNGEKRWYLYNDDVRSDRDAIR